MRKKPKPKDRTTPGGLRPLYVYLQVAAWEQVERISQQRTERTGSEPTRADLWREAMMRGLRQMLAEEGA